MKRLLIVSLFLIILLVGCASTHSNTSIGEGRFLAVYTDKQVGADGTSAIQKVMAIAQKECLTKKVKVVSINNSGFAFGSFPQAVLTYECD